MAVVTKVTGPGDDPAVVIHQLTALDQISNNGLQALRELEQGRALGSLAILISLATDLFELQNWCFFHRVFWYR
jgi:hypothetical protein